MVKLKTDGSNETNETDYNILELYIYVYVKYEICMIVYKLSLNIKYDFIIIQTTNENKFVGVSWWWVATVDESTMGTIVLQQQEKFPFNLFLQQKI